MSFSFPLAGQTALVTGVSRRRGIGFAIARALAELGADIVVQHHSAHDVAQPWGGDDVDEVMRELRACLQGPATLTDVACDLRDAAEIPRLFAQALAVSGRIQILVCNHAKSGDDGSILDMTPDRLDTFWQVNSRSTLLLTAAFARQFQDQPVTHGHRPGESIARTEVFSQPRGRVVWMTSGQGHGAMRGEIAYATSKAALAGATASVAAELLELGVLLNTVNPGPVNTGYLDANSTDRDLTDVHENIARTPFGRLGTPEDAARLIAWLCSPSNQWVTGQVLTSDGGFSL